jgi:hypothetical protein
MSKGPDHEKSVRGKKVWESPKITEVGDLRTLVQSLVPGKPSPGKDGVGVGGGEEMMQ